MTQKTLIQKKARSDNFFSSNFLPYFNAGATILFFALRIRLLMLPPHNREGASTAVGRTHYNEYMIWHGTRMVARHSERYAATGE